MIMTYRIPPWMCERGQEGLSRCKVNGNDLKRCFSSSSGCPTSKSPLKTGAASWRQCEAPLAKAWVGCSPLQQPHVERRNAAREAAKRYSRWEGAHRGAFFNWSEQNSYFMIPRWNITADAIIEVQPLHLSGKSLAFKSEEQYLLLSRAQTPDFFLSFFFIPSILFCVCQVHPSASTR